jgi:hypothetical protein
MPLTPSPLIPGTSPLLDPGQQPPNRRAMRIGALLTTLVLIVSLGAGQLLFTRILFFAPGLQAQANSSSTAGTTATFQGFVYPWTRDLTGGGYTTAASLTNMQSEAATFHMNSVIIPVVADMPYRADSVLLWHSSDSGDIHTLPDSNYEQAISDAKKAGLVPILELKVDQEDPLSGGSESSQYIGEFWSDFGSSATTGLGNGKNITVGPTEKQWFDNYTAFAVHYAEISQQDNLPYLIMGSDLTSVSYDTQGTNLHNDPHGVDQNVPGEPCTNPTGRRDCEWRHVIHALRAASYATLSKHQSTTGAGYTGKLIYEASWGPAPQAQSNGASSPEYSSIAWWDAVDYIGVDAEFPLTQNGIDVPVSYLTNAWNGQKTPYGAGNSGNIMGNLETVSQQFQRSVVFTTASYASAPGANAGQPANAEDENEQLFDVQALLGTFETQSWWSGVFWSADYPIAPRSSQPHWNVSSNWAGDTLATSKPAGQWLAMHYKNNPLH